ncbi:MAG: glycoside hydrolase family 3 C-terminal domain-containing protein [Gemmatimonadaceae bacterium]|nr:glycoside hydrolase family 3 C-terminal domain-containing protein [Gemmatimonadaceae bacterium]
MIHRRPAPLHFRLAALLLAGLLPSAASAQSAADTTARPPADAPYRDARRSPAARAHDLLGRMTAEEKFWQLFMAPGDRDDPALDYRHGAYGLQVNLPAGMRAESPRSDTLDAAQVARAHTRRINDLQRWFVDSTRLGIPLVPFEETLHGLTREGTTTFPQAIGLAATWDTALVGRVGAAIATETRSRGIRHALSPVINIASDPRWGRVEETYGEDPWLTAAIARAWIRPLEAAGIVTTPKHFIANVGDGGRDSYPIDLSPRLLAERHFPPFISAIHDAGARSVMSAYNSVDGSPASQNRALLTDRLRRDWGFTGVVISDASAVGGSTVLHNTDSTTGIAFRRAIEAGLDVVFESGYRQHRSYLDGFRSAGIEPAAIDTAVARVLRLKFALGLFEQWESDPAAAAAVARTAAHRAVAREAAAASIVLLRNARQRLPLDRATRRIAVIGQDATEGRTGGYAPPGARLTTILDGIRAGAPAGSIVRSTPGVPRLWSPWVTIPATAFSTTTGSGVRAEYWDNITLAGAPVVARLDRDIAFAWTLYSPAPALPFDWYSARWTTTVTAPASGVRTLAVEGNDGYRLHVDGRLVIDNWQKASFGLRQVRVDFAPHSRHEIRLEYHETTGSARLRLAWDAGVTDPTPAAIADAVRLARSSDVALIVAGIEEGEFRDRAMLGLPGRQDALIRAVAATGTPVVVILVGGSAITMPWRAQVDAVIDAWYPGQEGGHAVADVLFGRVNPSGRLPLTFPMHEGQVPLYYAHKPTGRGDDYLDLTGLPLFPFGHGLSYSTFTYDDLATDVQPPADSTALRVSATIRNTGTRAGAEVVQLYLTDVLASVVRPVTELAGFARVPLAPGESRRVSFAVSRHQLSLLDADMQRVVEPGRLRVMLGASSRDIRLRREVAIR